MGGREEVVGHENVNGGEYRRSIHLASRRALGSSFNALFERVRREFKNENLKNGRDAPLRIEELKEDEGQVPLVRYIPDIAAVFGADGALRYASPSLEQVLDYEPEDLVGRVLLGLLHPDDIERAATTFMQIRTNPGSSQPVEVRARHADGSWRYLEGVVNNLLDDPGVEGIVVAFRDVTERKRVEEELRRSESSLATAQRIAHVGSWEYYITRVAPYKH